MTFLASASKYTRLNTHKTKHVHTFASFRQALTDEQVENLQLDAEHPDLEQGFKLSTSKNKILDISKSK